MFGNFGMIPPIHQFPSFRRLFDRLFQIHGGLLKWIHTSKSSVLIWFSTKKTIHFGLAPWNWTPPLNLDSCIPCPWCVPWSSEMGWEYHVLYIYIYLYMYVCMYVYIVRIYTQNQLYDSWPMLIPPSWMRFLTMDMFIPMNMEWWPPIWVYNQTSSSFQTLDYGA
jgi:hypothetical protein